MISNKLNINLLSLRVEVPLLSIFSLSSHPDSSAFNAQYLLFESDVGAFLQISSSTSGSILNSKQVFLTSVQAEFE